MSEKPQVIDLRKNDEDEQDPARNPENEMDSESEGDVYEEAREEYPEGVEDNTESGDGEPRTDPSGQAREEYTEEMEEPAENEGDGETSKGHEQDPDREAEEDEHEDDYEMEEDEKAFSYKHFNLTAKLDADTGFADLKEGSLVLVDTPLDGAKVGEVVGKEESWTGTLYVKVDTGANKYDITPYDDEFSEKYIATIGEEGEVTPDLLQRLGKTEVAEVDVGNQVVLDVPKVGPVRGTVAHKAQTESQGAKVDVNTGPATFTVYEDPSPSQKKEQPVMVGRVQ